MAAGHRKDWPTGQLAVVLRTDFLHLGWHRKDYLALAVALRMDWLEVVQEEHRMDWLVEHRMDSVPVLLEAGRHRDSGQMLLGVDRHRDSAQVLPAAGHRKDLPSLEVELRKDSKYLA